VKMIVSISYADTYRGHLRFGRHKKGNNLKWFIKEELSDLPESDLEVEKISVREVP